MWTLLPSSLLLPLYPLPPQYNAPSIPCGNVRQETVSALLQNLQRYLPSQHAAELETVQQIHACTEPAHAHGRYPGSEIIDADGAAVDREGGESQSKGQISPTWRKPWKKICWKIDHVCPEPKYEQLLCLGCFHLMYIRKQQHLLMWNHICLQIKYLEKGVFQWNVNL